MSIEFIYMYNTSGFNQNRETATEMPIFSDYVLSPLIILGLLIVFDFQMILIKIPGRCIISL